MHLEKLSLIETYHLDGNLPSERVNVQNVIFPQTEITSVQPIPLCESDDCLNYQIIQHPESAGLWSVIYEPDFPTLGQKTLACINSCSSTITDIPYSDWMIRDYNISNFDEFMVKQGDTLIITTTPKKPECSQQFTVNETYMNVVSLTSQTPSDISASE